MKTLNCESTSSINISSTTKNDQSISPRSIKNRSKRYIEAAELVDRNKEMIPLEAIKLMKKAATANFIETLEVAARLNLNTKYNDQQIRTTVNLPKGSGNVVRVAVITQGEKISEAKSAGADIVGSEDLIENISDGFLEFDKLIATPDMMPKIAKLGRLLGPKGMMPNPKTGTVTLALDAAIKDFKAGKVEFRTDKVGIVHVGIGKTDFQTEDLIENLKSTINAIEINKPAGAKGVFWKSLFISSSMGPAIRIDITKARELKDA